MLEVVKGGKEATVYRCRACPSTGVEFLAAKVYRPLEFRSFRNDAVYRQGRAILDARSSRAMTIIDFPQAVDPRTNPNAYALLQRDVENVCKGFARHGVQADAGALAAELWAGWLRGELR